MPEYYEMPLTFQEYEQKAGRESVEAHAIQPGRFAAVAPHSEKPPNQERSALMAGGTASKIAGAPRELNECRSWQSQNFG